MTAGYYHRTFQNICDRPTGRCITTADYTSFTVPMPALTSPSLAGGIDATLIGVIDPGEMLTVYNLNAAKAVYRSSRLSSTRTCRRPVDLQRHRPVGPGPAAGRQHGDRQLDDGEEPLGVLLATTTIRTARRSTTSTPARRSPTVDAFCDQRKFDVPFTHEFKVAGNYPLPYGVEVGAVLQSYAGSARIITWEPAAALFPAAQHELGNDRAERAGLALLSALQPARPQRQEELPRRPQDASADRWTCSTR